MRGVRRAGWAVVGVSCATMALWGCGGAPREAAAPEALDLTALEDSLQAHVDRGELPGARLLVTRGGAVVGDVLVGFADVESRTPLEPRSVFRLASATKIFVSVAFLTLVDEGRVRLADPVSLYLPEFAELSVFDGEDGPRSASNQLTVLDLLRHTGGMGYGYEDPYQAALVEAGLLKTGVRFGMDWSHPWSLSEWASRLGQVPLEAEPGTVFSYGLGHDVLGLLIERITGQRLDDFVAQRVLVPLGLDDTGFSVPAPREGALTSFYAFEDSALVRVETGGESPFLAAPRAPSGGGGWDQLGNGGMVSSAPDFARLLQMLLEGGAVSGVRILSEDAVDLLMRNHLEGIGDGTSYWPGAGFSLGLAYLFDPGSFPDGGNAGTMWWAGSTNVYFWMDPAMSLAGVFMTHALPFGHLGAMDAARALVYEALAASAAP